MNVNELKQCRLRTMLNKVKQCLSLNIVSKVKQCYWKTMSG